MTIKAPKRAKVTFAFRPKNDLSPTIADIVGNGAPKAAQSNTFQKGSSHAQSHTHFFDILHPFHLCSSKLYRGWYRNSTVYGIWTNAYTSYTVIDNRM